MHQKLTIFQTVVSAHTIIRHLYAVIKVSKRKHSSIVSMDIIIVKVENLTRGFFDYMIALL